MKRINFALKEIQPKNENFFKGFTCSIECNFFINVYLHNVLRTHSGLSGKIPAETAGIKHDLDNRWKSLIELTTKCNAEKFPTS